MVLYIVTALPYNMPIDDNTFLLLLADGVSFLLLADGSTFLALA